MTGVLGFSLACAAVFLAAGSLASIPAWLLARAATRVGWSAARRADLALFAGLLPLLVAMAVLAGVMLPSVADAAGWRPDHCVGHDHHVHLCLVHAATIPARLAAIGAIAAVVVGVRAASALAALARTRRLIRALEQLGRTEDDIVHLPGAPRLCHAAGWIRPRVLLSEALASVVAPEHLAAALEHERAHVRRRDPLAGALLALASSATLPFAARAATRAFREAAEEAADAEAARIHGGIGVADALLAVARVQTHAPLFAFGEGTLERRVRALLVGAPAATARGLSLAGILGVASLTCAALGADAIHHAVESLLG